jgi:hypothetical protein
MYLMFCYTGHLIMGDGFEIEENWGTDSDEEQNLLKSLNITESCDLFVVGTPPIDVSGLNSTHSAHSQLVPKTSPQFSSSIPVFNLQFQFISATWSSKRYPD